MNKKRITILAISLAVIASSIAFFSIIRAHTKPSPIPENQLIPSPSSENSTTNTSNITITESEPTPTTYPHLQSTNCTTSLGPLMLINPNYPVDDSFIAMRRSQLIDLTAAYGIEESNYWNGTPLLDAEAAEHLHAMITDYEKSYPGHTLHTLSCFRSVGTSCGRLCVATGGSDHHSGYTCDLHDPAYGAELNTNLLPYHPEWQWLHDNSYRYGFIDRFIESWAGGTMDEPANIDATGTTGLFETWHYRYVGIDSATDIATGKFNNGTYDSLEHYLLEKGLVTNLLDPTACDF